MKKLIYVIALLWTVGFTFTTCTEVESVSEIPFTRVKVDNYFNNPHCKTMGDINSDGFIDLVVGGAYDQGGVIWYEYISSDTWERHIIALNEGFTTSAATADVDGDGDLDIIIPTGVHLGDHVWWFENPAPLEDPAVNLWPRHDIGAAESHDVRAGDINHDGLMDIVTHTNQLIVFLQSAPDTWSRIVIDTSSNEGTALGDIDNDGDLDIAIGGIWYETPDDPENDPWINHSYADDILKIYQWSVHLDDINQDGFLDIMVSPSDPVGNRELRLYLAPHDPKTGQWERITIFNNSDGKMHGIQSGDIDSDGDIDIITAEMEQTSEKRVLVFRNGGDSRTWTHQVIDTIGSHWVHLGDIDNDNDLDIYGANHGNKGGDAAIYVWRNMMAEEGLLTLPLGQWTRHLIDEATPWQSVFVSPADIDNDGHTDIIAGGWWYKNPGSGEGIWERQAIGSPLYNMAFLYDFDNDGDIDIFGTNGQHSSDVFFWAENDGSGNFTISDNIERGDGDFLQGVAGARFTPDGPFEIALSWHAGSKGVQMLTLPEDPLSDTWLWRTINSNSQDEALSVGDIDGDGDNDLFQGSTWLRNDEISWTQFSVSNVSGPPDRNRLADIDGDNDLDAVVGFEGTTTDLIWLEQQSEPTTAWHQNTIAQGVGGGFSMDVADMDNDGDIDVILGEHNGQHRVLIYENNDNGQSWIPHIVDEGGADIDHHDGTRVVDIDNDGDLDIISIGWLNDKVWLFENKAIDGELPDTDGEFPPPDGEFPPPDGEFPTPIDTLPPTIISALAIGNPYQVKIVFSEPIKLETANSASNYELSPDGTISQAILQDDQQTVILKTSLFQEDITYTLKVNNIRDLSDDVISPDSQVKFEYKPTIIDFEDLSLNISSTSYTGATLRSGGFTFTSEGTIFIINNPEACSGKCADNGTQTIISLDSHGYYSGGSIEIRSDSGKVFNIVSFDAAEGIVNNSQFPQATAITITGTRDNGTTISETFALDGIIDSTGSAADFQTFLTTDLANAALISATISASGSSPFGDGSFSLDNILLDEPRYTITAKAGINGTISPSGELIVNHDDSQTFTIKPEEGYDILDVLVDGTSQGPQSIYQFMNVTENHTIEAVFMSTPISAVIDFEGFNLNGDSFLNTGSTLNVGEFTFMSEGTIFIISNPEVCSGKCADNGTLTLTSLDSHGSYAGGPIVISNKYGKPFSIASFDAAEGVFNSPEFPQATSITITGTRKNGTTISEAFALDGIIDSTGPKTDFETFLPTDLADAALISATISTSGSSPLDDGSFSIDNILLTDPREKTIDFRHVDLMGGSYLNVGSTLNSDGFTFTSEGSIFIIGNPEACGGKCADNGTLTLTSLDSDGIFAGGSIVITGEPDKTFSIVSFDAAEGIVYNSQFPQATSITIKGTLEDGTTISETFVLDGIIDSTGPATDFQTFLTTDLADVALISATFNASGPSLFGDGAFSIDNIVLLPDSAENSAEFQNSNILIF